MTDGIIKKIKVTSSRGETVYDIGTAAANVEFSEGNEVVSGDKKLEDDLTSVVGKKALGSIYNTGYIYNDFIITQPSDIGERTLTMGANNITSGRYSFSIGSNIINSHINAGAIGSNLKTWGDNQLVIGELSEPNKNEGVATALSNYNFIVHNSNALWSPAPIDYQSEAAFAVGGEKALFQVPIEIYGSFKVLPAYASHYTVTYFEVNEDGVIINKPLTLNETIKGTAQADIFTGNIIAYYNRYTHAGQGIDNINKNEIIKTHKDVSIAGSSAGSTNEDTFYVRAYDGIVHASSTTISGLDYAEYLYPWWDDNIEKEDRVGYFVTVKNNLLYKATSEDTILGVISETYGVLGTPDALNIWKNKYKKDKFGRFILDEFGNQILNENFNNQNYISRDRRAEWSAVGLIGQIYVRDDGTCIPGQYCKCNSEGIATFAEKQDFNTWFVLERIDTDVVKILFK